MAKEKSDKKRLKKKLMLQNLYLDLLESLREIEKGRN